MKSSIFVLVLIYIESCISAAALITPTKKVTFTISAKSLPSERSRLGQLHLSDSFVSIDLLEKTREGGRSSRMEGQNRVSTSTIWDDNNPEWPEKFSFNWKKGTGQTLQIRAFDRDRLSPQDPIGETEVNVDEFMGKCGNYDASLSNGGSITITKYPYQSAYPMSFVLSAKNLPWQDLLTMGLSDPYATIAYSNKTNGVKKVWYKTGIITDSSNPIWPRLIEFKEYRPGTNQILYFQLFDRDLVGNDDILGVASINADDLAKYSGKVTIALQTSKFGIKGDAEIILQLFPKCRSAGLLRTLSRPPTPPGFTSDDDTEVYYDDGDVIYVEG